MKHLIAIIFLCFSALAFAEQREDIRLAALEQIDGFENLSGGKKFDWIRLNGPLNLKMSWESDGLIDQVEWTVDLEDGYPDYDFDDLLSMIAKAERELQRFPWIKKWRENSKDNHVKITIYDNRFANGDKMHSQDIWKRIPMEGELFPEIRLNGENNWRCNVQLGKTESRSMIIYISGDQVSSDLWYQNIPGYSDWSNENYPIRYILISKEGDPLSNITDGEYFQGVLPRSAYEGMEQIIQHVVATPASAAVATL
ncbi:MAG: hypothetical protein AAF583_15245 [Pseudomonadota bacterium]